MLLDEHYFTVHYMIAPTAKVQIPVGLHDWDKKKRVDWANRNTTFCYVTGLKNDNDSRTVCVFEKLHYDGQQRVAVAFNDNHVQVLSVAEADRLIKKQTGRSLAEWSASKYPGAGGKN